MLRALRFLVHRDGRKRIPALIAVLLTLLDEEDRLFDALECLARTTVPRDWKAWIDGEGEYAGTRSYRGFSSLQADVVNEWSERITAAR